MSYEVYKILHVFFVILFAALAGVSLAKEELPKSIKIGIGVSSFLILVGGMGLLARIGVSHGSAFPGWVVVKMVAWLALAAMFGIISKRGASNKPVVAAIAAVLFVTPIIMAVLKPF